MDQLKQGVPVALGGASIFIQTSSSDEELDQ